MENIKRKYDEIVIRCALAHLVDIGMQSAADDELIEKTIEDIKEGEVNRKKKGVPVIGANFQIAILRAASDIAKATTPAELFVWVRNNLTFANTKDEERYTENLCCPRCGSRMSITCLECMNEVPLTGINYCPECGQRISVVNDEWEEEEDDDSD